MSYTEWVMLEYHIYLIIKNYDFHIWGINHEKWTLSINCREMKIVHPSFDGSNFMKKHTIHNEYTTTWIKRYRCFRWFRTARLGFLVPFTRICISVAVRVSGSLGHEWQSLIRLGPPSLFFLPNVFSRP